MSYIGVSNYEKNCTTLEDDKGDESWNKTIMRLSKECKKLETDREALENDGIYIKYTEDFSVFNVMIMKRKDAGSYLYTPMFFEIKPCKDSSGMVYPMCPPIAKYISFSSSWLHPNLKPTGNICISVLQYSYVGNSNAASVGWNPMLGMRSLSVMIAGLLDEAAMLNEPGYSTSNKNDKKVKDYDQGAEYLCMNRTIQAYAVLKDGKEKMLTLFKDDILKHSKDAIESVITRCEKYMNCTSPTISTYSFDVICDYKLLHEKATRLLSTL